MPDISSVGHPVPGPRDRNSPSAIRNAHSPTETTTTTRTPSSSEPSHNGSSGLAPIRPGTETTVDRVELSANARSLGRIEDLPKNRRERVETLRKGIREGTYETSEKMETALDRLIKDLE